ncbi:hypothetical protein C8R43DRAFT_877555 [Mycena crocata]|nr:hypothetical protein C8R43DRAFT_877555 [Mycena crocata]
MGPTAAKYLAIIVFLLNAGSWPFMWHFKILTPVVEAYFGWQMLKLRHLFSSKHKRAVAREAWFESGMPIGEHPFRRVWKKTSWVSLDQSDFNLHMSNSSYATTLDAARFRLALETFPNVFLCGGWAPLAAQHYHFIREIPMLTSYEVRATIGAWDDKWVWFVSRFVKPPSKSKSKSSSNSSASNSQSITASELPTPGGINGVSGGIATGFPGGTPSGFSEGIANGMSNGAAEPDAITKALLAAAARTPEPDGATLYTVCVSQNCFKQGRITIPPALVLAANGFYAAPEDPASASTSSPQPTSSSSNSPNEKPPQPPHWPAVRALTSPASGGSLRALAAFYKGGWRDVPAGQRWWEDALQACEAQRRVRVVPFVGEPQEGGALRKGGISGGLEAVGRLQLQ